MQKISSTYEELSDTSIALESIPSWNAHGELSEGEALRNHSSHSTISASSARLTSIRSKHVLGARQKDFIGSKASIFFSPECLDESYMVRVPETENTYSKTIFGFIPYITRETIQKLTWNSDIYMGQWKCELQVTLPDEWSNARVDTFECKKVLVSDTISSHKEVARFIYDEWQAKFKSKYQYTKNHPEITFASGDDATEYISNLACIVDTGLGRLKGTITTTLYTTMLCS
ncbi:uncharacterized protein L201_007819 [Kwoniella dendrophila CBS 6074]|uniref:SUN domain-containing protein n=1 Tax=Kwoniella dendrophila CBS 6074 TaxID=1295534 RepID=A0AAX4K6R4_9TREE